MLISTGLNAETDERAVAEVRHVLQVADLIKADRLVRLNAVVNEIAEERAQRFLGRTLEVRSSIHTWRARLLQRHGALASFTFGPDFVRAGLNACTMFC